MIKHITMVVAVLLTAITAQANELNVYPVPAVFTSKNIDNATFTKVLNDNRQEFINTYLQEFSRYFPNADTEITDKNKYKTFVAYVHVPRASQYEVEKTEKLLDIYLPLTMSINFVNMASGETLYSYPMTNYFKYETSTENDEQTRVDVIEQLCKKNYKQTMDEVVKQASIDFKPFDITAKIVDNYRGFYILDKGLETGVVKGDLLTDENVNQISVIYSDLGYAVAKKVLGNPTHNTNFSKFANSSITQLKKPKVLLINDFGDEKLYNIFSTALGSSAEFSLINTDKTYFDMQTALVSLNDSFKTNNVYNKSMPEYFLKLYFTRPFYAQYKSKKDYFNMDRYGMIACGVIFDKTGRVVYSTCADDEIKNEVVGNIRFNDIANYEIIGKNIFNKLASNMQKDIQFKDIDFKINKVENQYLSVLDADGFLKVGNVLTVYKKIKTEKSGKEILVPTWDYRVVNINGNLAECKMSKPYIDGIDYPDKKDVIKMTTMARTANKANMLNYNPINTALSGNEFELKSFNKIAFSALTANIKAPIAMPRDEFQHQIQELNALGFKDNIEIPDNTGNSDIKAVYKIKLKSEEAKGSVIKKEYEIIVGITIEKNGETIKQDALMQTVTFVIPQENDRNIIEHELIKVIYPLIGQLAKTM